MAHDNSYAQVCSLCCIEDLSPMDAEAKGFKNSNCDGDGGRRRRGVFLFAARAVMKGDTFKR